MKICSWNILSLSYLPQKICQKFAQSELRQAQVSVVNIFEKWDKRTFVVTISYYKTVWGNYRFLFYHELYSIQSFHAKKNGVQFYSNWNVSKRKHKQEKNSHGFFSPQLLFLSCNKKFSNSMRVGARQKVAWRRIFQTSKIEDLRTSVFLNRNYLRKIFMFFFLIT